jgi:hypothetical protein
MSFKNPWQLAGTFALVALPVGGIGMFATPANAATGPTATVDHGLVKVTGTPVRDVIHVTVNRNGLTVDVGFDGTVEAHFARSEFRDLQVLGGGGDDGLVVSGTGQVPVTINGGLGNDFIGVLGSSERGDGDAATVVRGQDGNDDVLAATPGPITISTGAGDDSVEGGDAGIGQETISLGAGNDRFVSSLNAFVGARNDIVDGGTGKDALAITGSFASESLNLVPKSGHLIVEHSFGDEIDSDNIEDVSWVGFGGLDESGLGDSVSVADLSGTDVVHFNADFTDPLDNLGPNNSADQLRVVGTPGVDHISVIGLGSDISVAGLNPAVTATNLDHQDTLRIDTLAGRDSVDRSGLQQGVVQLQVF